MTNWPKHADGRNKKIGEMTREEARTVTKAACHRVQAHFDRPEVQAGIEKFLNEPTEH
jgi:hypothetical protein